MGRAGAFALILATMVVLQHVGEREAALSTVALALGFALIAASLLGELAERLHLPRLSGYLIFGLLCGPYILNLITASMARELQIVNGLAIAIIAFTAGLEINFARLRSRARRMLVIGIVMLGMMYALLVAVFLILWPWLPIEPAATGLERLAIVLVFSTVVASFSPMVTIAVITECRARGPLSELVIAMVVIADLVLILAFTLFMQFARWTIGGAESDVSLFAHLAWEIGGSLAFGALAGAAFAIYLRAVGRELTLVLLGLTASIGAAGPALHFEPLLTALAAGLVVENVAPARADALRDAVERGALPVLVIFFAAAGASLNVDLLATIGLAAAAVALIRLLAIRSGAHLGLRAAGVTDQTSGLLWMGLVSQAGVTLGLAILVGAEFPGWGTRMQMLMIAMIALHELVGPVLFKAALQRAGEINRMDDEISAAPDPAAADRSTT
jgi:Kef-type K+ transport system membrane component KefB